MKAVVSNLLAFPSEVHTFIWHVALLVLLFRRLLSKTVKDLETVCITNWAWEIVTCLTVLYLVMFSTGITEYNIFMYIKANVFQNDRSKTWYLFTNIQPVQVDGTVEGYTELTDTYHYFDHYQVKLSCKFSVIWRNDKKIHSMKSNGLFSTKKKKKVIMKLQLHKIQVKSCVFK